MHPVPLLHGQRCSAAQLVLAEVQPLPLRESRKQNLHGGMLRVGRPRIARPHGRLEEQPAVAGDLRPVRVPEEVDAHEVIVTVLCDARRAGSGKRLHCVPPEALLQLVARHGGRALALG